MSSAPGWRGSCAAGSRRHGCRSGSPTPACTFSAASRAGSSPTGVAAALGLVQFRVSFAELRGVLSGRRRGRRHGGPRLLRVQPPAEPAHEIRRAPEGGRVRRERGRARARDAAADPAAGGDFGRGLPDQRAQPPGALRGRRLLRRLQSAGRRGRPRRRGRRGQGDGRRADHGDGEGGDAVSRGGAARRRGPARGEPPTEAAARGAGVRRAGLCPLRAEDRPLRARKRGTAGPVRARRRFQWQAARPLGARAAVPARRAARSRLREGLAARSPRASGCCSSPTDCPKPRHRRASLSATRSSRRSSRSAASPARLFERVRSATSPTLADDWTVLVLERTT